MSMHEFEDIVEMSIICLNKSSNKQNVDIRSLFYTLYDFQAQWDTGFTNFRVMDILLENHYTYRFDLQEYPDYEKYKIYFESIKEKNYESILIEPDKKWDKKDNVAAGYYKNPYLYCDVNSPLWEKMVQAGKLTGKDAQKAEKLDILQTIKIIVEEAEKQNNIGLLQLWYPIFTTTFLFKDQEEIRKISYNTDAILIRDIIARNKAFDIKSTYGTTRLPDLKTIENNFKDWDFYNENDPSVQFLKWWYEPLEEYYKKQSIEEEKQKLTYQYWVNKAVGLIKEAQDQLKRANTTNTPLLEQYKKMMTVEQFSKTLEQFKEQLNIWRDLGLKKLQEAEENLDKAMSINKENPYVWLNKGIIYNEQEKFQEAIEAYTKALSFDSTHDNCYAYRGLVYQKMEQTHLAKQDYEKALNINPNNEFAKYYLTKLSSAK